MPKTSTEVCTEALRLIGVVSIDEPATSEDLRRAKAHLDDIYASLDDTDDLAVRWTVETVPDGAFLSMARAVAGSVASSYGRSARAAEAAADIKPGDPLYQIGVDGVRTYEARALNMENHVVTADYM